MQRDLVGVLKELDGRSRVIGLVVLLSEALFLGALTRVPEEQVIWALLICAAILVCGLVSVVAIESRLASTRLSKEVARVADDVRLIESRVEFYDLIASHYDERNTNYLLETHRAVIGEISGLVRGDKDVEILDIGCGTGRLIASQFFQNGNIRWVGVDNSAGMVAQFRRNLEHTQLHTEPVVADLADLDRFDGRSFDVILMSMVLTSMPDLPDFGAIAKLLAPGGWLIVADIDPVYTQAHPVYSIHVDIGHVGLKMVPRHPLDVLEAMRKHGLTTLRTRAIRRSDGSHYSYVLVAATGSA